MSFKDFFRLLLESLEKCGYVVRFNLLDACSYGVPQRRLRVIIDGAGKDLGVIPKYPLPTHFDLNRKQKGFLSPWLVAQKCFALHGFTKDEVKDVWWNTKLEILMNKKKAAAQVDQTINELLLEAAVGLLVKPSKKKRKKKRLES